MHIVSVKPASLIAIVIVTIHMGLSAVPTYPDALALPTLCTPSVYVAIHEFCFQWMLRGYSHPWGVIVIVNPKVIPRKRMSLTVVIIVVAMCIG
jgi:hypothetical protein